VKVVAPEAPSNLISGNFEAISAASMLRAAYIPFDNAITAS
jgi:hypothetical protein